MEPQKVEVSEVPDTHDAAEKKVVTKITSDKPKDPKRVAQGKRLAVISKEAKERKMRERMQAENAQNNSYWTNVVLGATAVVLMFGYLSYYKVFKNKIKNKDKPVVTLHKEKHNEAPTILDMLE